MKRRIFCTFLALVMVVYMIPSGSLIAYAADDVPWSDLLLDAEKWTYNPCDITVENEQKINVTSDTANEEYSLLIKPDKDTGLVMGQEKAVLQTNPFDIFADQYDSLTELIHILRNAVMGIGLSSIITGFNDKISGTYDTVLVAMNGIKRAADATINDLIKAYKYDIDYSLVKANTNGVALAEETLNKIKMRSESIAGQVDDLLKRFESSDEIITDDVMKKIMDERDLDSAKRDETRAEMDSIVKKIDYLQEQKSVLYDKISEYSKRYTDFSYQLPGEELKLAKAAGISSIYGGIAAMSGLPKDDAAIISEQQKHIQTAYIDVIQEMISLIDGIADSSMSGRNVVDTIVNALIATHCGIKLIEVYIRDISAFWGNVSDFCQNMIDRFDAIADVYAQSAGGNYIDFFKDKEFVEAYLLCMVNWTALNKLSAEFLNNFYPTREKVKEYLKEGETAPNVHLERVSSGAAALSAKMKDQSQYLGTAINERSSNGLIIVMLCVAAGLCSGVAALIVVKKKKRVNGDGSH